MDLELQRKLVTEGLTPSAQSTSEAAERKVELTQAWDSPAARVGLPG